MTNTKKTFFINSLFLTTSTILEKALFFIVNILIARYLSRENYGEYSAALAFGTFFAIFANLGISASSIRAINFYKDKADEYFTGTIFLKLILSFLTFTIILSALLITDFNRNTVLLTLILSLVRIINDFLTTLNQLFEAKSNFLVSSIYNSLFALLFLSGTYAVILFEGDYFDISHVRLFIILSITIAAFVHLLKFYNVRFNIKTIKKFAVETLPFSSSVIFSSITMNFSAVILPVMHGTIYSGIYNNAFIFFVSLLFVPANFNRVLLAHLYQHSYQENKDLYRYSYNTYSKFFSIISFYIAVIFFLFSEQIITLIFGAKYSDSVNLLKIFALAVPFAFNISGVMISSLDKQFINSRIDIITAFINIIISLVLIRNFKAEGAVLSLVIAYYISYVLSTGYLRVRKYISYRKTLTARFLLLMITLICYTINKQITVNTPFILSILTISVIYILLVVILLLDKHDIRLIREIFIK